MLIWTENRDVEAMQTALSNIIGAYERDFSKHPDVKGFPRNPMIWRLIPSRLSGRIKVYFKAVKEGARAREYEDALQWLADGFWGGKPAFYRI